MLDILKNKKLCKVRTITSFITLSKDKSSWAEKIKKTTTFANSLSNQFDKNNYEVQSLRIVTNAFGEYLDTSSLENTINDMAKLEAIIKNLPMDNMRIRFAIGEAKTDKEIEMIPKLICKFGDLSNFCVNIGVDSLGIPDNNKTKLCAKIVKIIGQTSKSGEGNFNFTVNYNCKPLIPYFPASFHNSSDEDYFVIGLETPDLLVEALKTLNIEKNHNLKYKKSYEIMNKALQYHIDNILEITNDFTYTNKNTNKILFKGIDTSAAPSKNCSSLVDVYKLLGVDYFGAAGTVEASSLLTKVFKNIQNCELAGFSGLMLAVIEDTGLAQATKDNLFDIRSLLTYSSVCGIGLDTVPIEGDTSVNKIADIMRDTGTMAFRLNKPLTVRLFPLPNFKAGDITKFESDDLCNSAVLSVP